MLHPSKAVVLLAATEIQAAPLKLVEQASLEKRRIDQDTIFVDFGRVAFGNQELAHPENSQGPVTVQFGESLKNGRIDTKPLYPIIALIGLGLTIVPSLVHLFGTLELKMTFNLMTTRMILWVLGATPWLTFKKEEFDNSTQNQI